MPAPIKLTSDWSAGASALGGTQARTLDDAAWAQAVQQRQQERPGFAAGRTAGPVVSLPQAVFGTRPPDPLRPDQATGRDVTMHAPIPADSPILPGGKVDAIFRNASDPLQGPDYGGSTPSPDTAARLDLRFFDKDGRFRGAVRLNPDQSVQVSALLTSPDRDAPHVVLGVTGDPALVNGRDANPSATALSVAVSGGGLGARLTLTNPLEGATATAKPGPTGERLDVFATPVKGTIVSSAGAGNDVEVGPFYAESSTPGSTAATTQAGVALTVNGYANEEGTVSLDGGVSLFDQDSTTAKGARAEGLGASAILNLFLGKPGGVQGVVNATASYSPSVPQASPQWEVQAGVKVPL